MPPGVCGAAVHGVVTTAVAVAVAAAVLMVI